ncbi:MAG: 3-hydroxyacyl-CoA dehydrogenase family protein [Candidatus Bathyarchaeota archaeon]|nr:3-hydroxyacyl-CoA dehydrogenase family protein [Candidatus Bathyarchaeota archaeon]
MIDEVKRVACVGSGLVGQGWAALFALNGYEVVMQDLTDEKLSEAYSRVLSHISTLVDNGLGKDKEAAAGRLSTTTSLETALKGVDFVVESVFESLDVKRPLYAEMDRLAPRKVVFASSTSGLMMTAIARDMKQHPERAIVAHPWNPVHLVPLVELSPGEKTSKETTELTYRVMEDIGRVPVVLKKEVPGFIANRISVALWREALDLVDQGVASVEDVDKAIRAGPGIRWAIMGPYLVYHLGGGKGGIEYLMRHIGTSKSEWLKNMAKWTETPDSVVQKAIDGVNEMVGDKSLEELEAWRDKYLLALNKLLWSGESGVY